MENSPLAIFDEIWPTTLYYSTGSLTRFSSNFKNLLSSIPKSSNQYGKHYKASPFPSHQTEFKIFFAMLQKYGMVVCAVFDVISFFL